jgi:hypothetical protein
VAFNVVENIALTDKTGKLLLEKHLENLETFSTVGAEDLPFQATLVIDRNRISQMDEQRILHLFGKLKQEQAFPLVSLVLRFGETQYQGEKQEGRANKRWEVEVKNIEKLAEASEMFSTTTRNNLEEQGGDILCNSFSYLYTAP